jgi:N-acetylneuraminate synthase
MPTVVDIADHLVGDGHPAFVIAEAGSNHNGNLEQALRLIDVAADAGADAVKFQVFRAKKLYPRSAGVSDYLKLERPIYDVIAAMETPYEWLPTLAEHCGERGILFLASGFDEESVDRLDPYVAAHKVASYEMTHLPLVQHVAAKGKPVIVSTGTATLDEVGETVTAFRATGNADLILMQCTGAYPAPPESLELRAIPTLRDAFDVVVGFSDHSRDPVVAPVAARALGACVIEKHFTLSNELPGPDHRFALEPAELGSLVRAVRDVEQALGSGEKTVQAAEEELRSFARRSLFAIRPIEVGEPFTRDNVDVLRRGKVAAGLPPRELHRVLRARAARSVAAQAPITEDDVA